MEPTLLASVLNVLVMAYTLQVVQQSMQTIQTQQKTIQTGQEEIKKVIREEVKMTPLKSGTLTATGAEDTMIEYSSEEPFTITGWMDLKNMTDGDTVTIKQLFKLAEETEYSLFAQKTYTNAQTKPLIHITPRQAIKSAKVTLQQTTGTLKMFPFEFYKGGTV